MLVAGYESCFVGIAVELPLANCSATVRPNRTNEFIDLRKEFVPDQKPFDRDETPGTEIEK